MGAQRHQLANMLKKDTAPKDSQAASAQAPHSIVAAMAAALINFMLMFGMCAAYGMIMFREDRHEAHRALGVKMCLSSSFLGGGLMSVLSGIPIAIGGTDLNPAVFYGTFVDVISEDIAMQLGLSDGAEARRLKSSLSTSSAFCTGQHLLKHRLECEEYHEQLRATTIFAVATSSAMLGVIYCALGKLRLTRYMSSIPLSITEGFLACIGYKVFNYALYFCEFEPLHFMSAAALGLLLYFCKTLHIGRPAIVLPLGLMIPLGLFWGCVHALGYDVAYMRESNWLFSEIKNEPFYLVWADSLGKHRQINVAAWSKTMPDLLVMLIVCTLDCALKLTATENKLPLQPDPDAEILRFGVFNCILAFFGSAVTYMQLKFNVISFGVMRNATDRRAGMLFAMLCGTCYFTTIDLFNYLPKLFLSTLLFFAGAGFVIDNLWGSRKYFHLSEGLEIVGIVAAFIISGQLIFAVLSGLLLSGIAFIAKYARVPSIAGRALRGNEIITRERPVGEVAHQSLMHIAAAWLLVLRLKGYVFFSSSQAILKRIEDHFKDEDKNNVPHYKRLKYIIFCAKMLDGMDASGALCMLKVKRTAARRGVRVLWSDLKESLAEELSVREILDVDFDKYDDLDAAVTFVEHQTLSYRAAQQHKWMQLHPAFEADAKLMRQRISFEPFREIFLSEGARMGCPWRYCSRLRIKRGETILCTIGDVNRPLYLIHSGAVALWDDSSAGKEHSRAKRPSSVRRHGWFLNTQAVFGQPASGHALAVEDGEVLCWSKNQWWQLANERPLMMMELMKAVMRQEIIFKQEHDLENACNTEDEASSFEASEQHDDDVLESMMPASVTISAPASGGSDAFVPPINLLEVFRKKSLKMLPQLQARLTDMFIANALGSLGFFLQDESGINISPELPQLLKEDLRVAFFTYAEKRAKGDNLSEAILPASRVIQALLHVGIFHVHAEEVCKEDLLLDGFLNLGRDCHLAKLSPSQMQKIDALCSRHDEEGNGLFAIAETTHMLKMLFGIEFDVAINDAVAQCWGPETCPDTHVTSEQFAGIVSWYVKRRERDWNLLQGVFQVLKCRENVFSELVSLKVDDLRLQFPSLEHQGTLHEELIWAADWISGGQGQGTLDVCSFLTVLLTNLELQHSCLPPACVLSESEVRDAAEWQAMSCDGTEEAIEERAQDHISVSIPTEGPIEDVSGITDSSQSPRWARVTLDLLENPETSRAARCTTRCMAGVVVLNVVCICLEPLISGKREHQGSQERTLWLIADTTFISVFSIDLLLRWLATVALDPKLVTAVSFFANPSNICDLIAVCEILFHHLVHLPLLRALMLERIARIFRIAKLVMLSRNSKLPAVAPLAAVILVIMGTYLIYVEQEK